MPGAAMTVLAADLVTVRHPHDASSPTVSRPATGWEKTMCAPNIQACSQARRVSSCPLMPCGKPG